MTIGPADPEIIVLGVIIKEEIKKEKKINASKIYCRSSKFAERAKLCILCQVLSLHGTVEDVCHDIVHMSNKSPAAISHTSVYNVTQLLVYTLLKI